MEERTYEESKKIIESIRNKGEAVFRCAISHLMDVGIRALTDESVEATCNDIMKNDNSHSIMTNDFQCAIVRTAAELAKIEHTHLLVYIQTKLFYDVGQKEIDYDRLVQLLENCMEWIYEMGSGTEDFKNTLLDACNFETYEIKQLGFGYCLTEEEYDEED